MNAAINKFIEDFSSIEDTDYGDFMRKANHYLLELDDEMSGISSESIKMQLEQMKVDVQYYPNWDIASTREKTIQGAYVLDAMLAKQARPVSRDLESLHI